MIISVLHLKLVVDIFFIMLTIKCRTDTKPMIIINILNYVFSKVYKHYIISIIQIKNLGLEEIKNFAQDHRTVKSCGFKL